MANIEVLLLRLLGVMGSSSRGQQSQLSRPIRAIQHTADVLSAFSPAEPLLGVGEIAERVGLDKSSVSRVLSTLEELNFVARDEETKRYRLGLRLVEIAQIALGGLDVRQVAVHVVKRLAADTGETAQLAIWDTDVAVIIDRATSTENVVQGLGYIGQRMPAHCTSIGKVLLAYQDGGVMSGLLSVRLKKFTDKTITDRVRLEEELDQIRVSGVGHNNCEFRYDLSGVSSPIWDYQMRVCAAINVSGPAYRLPPKRLHDLAPHLRSAAAEITRELGGKPEVLR